MTIKLSNCVNFASSSQTVMWFAILLMFFCMLRSSNLVPKSTNYFDSEKQLCKQDILIGQELMVVRIRWSKVIQFAQRQFFHSVTLHSRVTTVPSDSYFQGTMYRRIVKFPCVICTTRDRVKVCKPHLY